LFSHTTTPLTTQTTPIQSTTLEQVVVQLLLLLSTHLSGVLMEMTLHKLLHKSTG